jgi:DNA-binding NtrC family response regulator
MAEQTHIPAAKKGNLARKRLLFVDDEPAIRATLPVILRRYGFTVTVAATVAEGIQEIQKQEFDLLLCDLNIEREGDGYDVVRAMQKVNPTCVVMILTAYPAVESAVEGIHLRIEDYIIKPSNADALVALLAEKLLAPRIQNADS